MLRASGKALEETTSQQGIHYSIQLHTSIQAGLLLSTSYHINMAAVSMMHSSSRLEHLADQEAELLAREGPSSSSISPNSAGGIGINMPLSSSPSSFPSSSPTGMPPSSSSSLHPGMGPRASSSMSALLTEPQSGLMDRQRSSSRVSAAYLTMGSGR